MLTAYDKLSRDSRQKWIQRHHGCFKHFNIVCGHKTATHLSVLHFWGDCQCSAIFASVSEALSEQWHRLRNDDYKERIIFEYGGRMSRSPYSFQGLSLDVWINDLQSPAFPLFFFFCSMSLHILLLLWTQMLNFTLFTVYGEDLSWNVAYTGSGIVVKKSPPSSKKKYFFLFPVSHILPLHTDLYLSNVSPSMKSIPLSVHSFSSLSYNRSKASSKRSSPHSCHLELPSSNESILSFP